MKRIIGLLMTAVLIIQMLSVNVLARDSAKKFENQTALLEAVGIYSSDDVMSDEAVITRSKMAVIMAGFIGISRDNAGDFGGNQIFSDIDNTAPYANALMAVVSAGWLSGYKDYTFRPDTAATAGDAAQALVSMLGYSVLAEADPTHNEGFYTQAAKIGLFDGISGITINSKLTNAQFSQMLINAMDAEIMETTFVGDRKEYEKKDISYLEVYFDTYLDKGLVKATNTAALLGEEETGINMVRVGDVTMSTTESFNDAIGSNIRFFYKNIDDEYKLIYWEEDSSKMDSVVIDAEDIIPMNNTDVLKYRDGNREKELNLDDEVSVIYNGKLKIGYTYSIFMPKEGTVKAIDSDGDLKYETVMVESYVDYWVKSASYKNGVLTIRDKRTGASGFTVDVEDTDCRFYQNESEVTYKAILPNSVISVAADGVIGGDAEIYKIVISTDTIKGQISVYDDTKNNAVVDGTDYRVSAYCTDTIVLGKEQTFYLNAFGKITAFEKYRDYSYGFVKNIYADETGDEYYIKYYTEKDEFETASLPERIKIDGKSLDISKAVSKMKTASDEFFAVTGTIMTNKSGYEQMVHYVKNDKGEVIEIDTIMTNEVQAEEDFTFFANTGETVTLSTYSGAVYFDNYNKSVGTRESMVHFVLPEDAGLEDEYTIKPISLISGTKTLNPVCFFDIDEVGCAEAAIQIGKVSNTVNDAEFDRMMVVEKVSIVYDEAAQDETTTLMSGYTVKKGNKIELKLYSNSAANGITPKCGDIITWNENSLGYATAIKKVMSLDGSGSLINNTNQTTPQNKEDRCSQALVEVMDQNYWKLRYTTEDNEWFETTITTSIESVVILEDNAITAGTIDDISEGDKLFIVSRYNRPVGVVVYK